MVVVGAASGARAGLRPWLSARLSPAAMRTFSAILIVSVVLAAGLL
jgi:hypothetical protein